MKEIWKTVIDWPDYDVSNLGRVYNTKTKRMLNTTPHNRKVVLFDGPEWFSTTLSRLVALVFVPGWFEGAEVGHKDGDKTNNRDWNLEWVTHQEIMRRSYASGAHKPRPVRIVETEEIFQSVRECAEHLGSTTQQIYNCLANRQKTHKGYHFRYADERIARR